MGRLVKELGEGGSKWVGEVGKGVGVGVNELGRLVESKWVGKGSGSVKGVYIARR